MEETLSIIKPDAVSAGLVNVINGMILAHGFFIVDQKSLRLSKELAREFYREHAQRPFFNSLIEFMAGGESVFQVLQAEDAVKKYRGLMGCTDPNGAEEHTIRYMFGESIERNVVHGSDSRESSEREIAFFYKHIKSK